MVLRALILNAAARLAAITIPAWVAPAAVAGASSVILAGDSATETAPTTAEIDQGIQQLEDYANGLRNRDNSPQPERKPEIERPKCIPFVACGIDTDTDQDEKKKDCASRYPDAAREVLAKTNEGVALGILQPGGPAKTVAVLTVCERATQLPIGTAAASSAGFSSTEASLAVAATYRVVPSTGPLHAEENLLLDQQANPSVVLLALGSSNDICKRCVEVLGEIPEYLGTKAAYWPANSN